MTTAAQKNAVNQKINEKNFTDNDITRKNCRFREMNSYHNFLT